MVGAAPRGAPSVLPWTPIGAAKETSASGHRTRTWVSPIGAAGGAFAARVGSHVPINRTRYTRRAGRHLIRNPEAPQGHLRPPPDLAPGQESRPPTKWCHSAAVQGVAGVASRGSGRDGEGCNVKPAYWLGRSQFHWGNEVRVADSRRRVRGWVRRRGCSVPCRAGRAGAAGGSDEWVGRAGG